MPEPEQYSFTFTEIAELMIKANNIHDGIWGIYVEFGISAANIGQADNDVLPSAIVPVVKLGLRKFDKTTNISVDASVVNPK